MDFMFSEEKAHSDDLIDHVRGNIKKTSIFKEIAHIGGREVNPISKKKKRNDFLTKVGEGGGDKTYCQK